MNPHIHRLLDEAFAGIAVTPDTQDLKEEVRTNLLARVNELEAAGAAPDDAAQRAIAELGDLRELVGEDAAVLSSAPTAPTAPARESIVQLALRNRVRPKPGYVVRTVIFALVATAGIAVALLSATGVLPIVVGGQIAMFGFAASALGMIVGDALSQETTTNHPMPQNRASGFALATFLTAFGLGFGGLIALGSLPLWGIVFAVLGVVAGVILFAFLGATQTNRHKAWTRQAHAAIPANRFEAEPETAARFGIYSAAIWVVAFGVFLAIGFTAGWQWAVLALLGGFAAMLIVLATMMYPRARRRD